MTYTRKCEFCGAEIRLGDSCGYTIHEEILCSGCFESEQELLIEQEQNYAPTPNKKQNKTPIGLSSSQ